ncbi:PREDICTED: baculoviral IAP repeat-containing protein 5-like [Amphimedon queenslandica]|uniref:Uncharacterized protein n=1 Tax=Amphimedon queenslandica TaxID=400682 RepID=A0AAN0IJI1_AMPQE|nr:PREDICTED: baculoviral IAP repeat-containing protein 5-like [Amphimedon queenslandica]|eukprot:XP_003392050.2 PREDICTED: baculoviral IAP repeat-containing protein 5-like [Amphimedon queenslandica]
MAEAEETRDEETQEESVSIFEGSFYTVEQRLETFKGSYWPYETGKCTPLKMAEAGFYFCGTSSTPDWVRCIVCHHEMDGWEETDDPWEEHCAHSPNCYYLKKAKDPYKITVGDVIEMEKEAIKCYVVCLLCTVPSSLHYV